MTDERNEVVPTEIVPSRPSRATPFLYTDEQVKTLMQAARGLPSPIRQASFQTIVGLLWATGMRIGEALKLDTADVDLAHGILTVRETKFGKSRELPIHETTASALHAYAKCRVRLCRQAGVPAFFLSAAGTRILYCNFHLGFQELVRAAGIERRSASCRPRPHDLRHSFAVRTLIGWYRDGRDVQAMLPRLSTYMGHVNPANTYWYLSAAPELLGLAADRLERAAETRS
jgi:integrase